MSAGVEELVAKSEGAIGQSFMAGAQNFGGFPFSVWLLDCDDSVALDLMRGYASAGRWKELMRKGKHAELPAPDQIDRWVAECKEAHTRPVATLPIRADRAMQLAKAIDRRVFAMLKREPSESEFWVIVVTGGDITPVAFPAPDMTTPN